jgi:biopolymer transport protein ExbD
MSKRYHLLSAVMSAALVLGCAESKPVRVVPLKVDSAGAYELDGDPVAAAELTHALRDLRSSPNTIDLHIHTALDTKHEAVGKAVVAAQEAGIARVSFATTSPK